MIDQQDLVLQLPALGSLGKSLDVSDGQGYEETHHHDVHHDDEGENEGVGQEGEVVELSIFFDVSFVYDLQLLRILQVIILYLSCHHDQNLKRQEVKYFVKTMCCTLTKKPGKLWKGSWSAK